MPLLVRNSNNYRARARTNARARARARAVRVVRAIDLRAYDAARFASDSVDSPEDRSPSDVLVPQEELEYDGECGEQRGGNPCRPNLLRRTIPHVGGGRLESQIIFHSMLGGDECRDE